MICFDSFVENNTIICIMRSNINLVNLRLAFNNVSKHEGSVVLPETQLLFTSNKVALH